MSNMAVLGVAPSWVVSWLTPLWLVGVGLLLGLALLGAGWLLLAGCSRLPGMGLLEQRRGGRAVAAGVAAVVVFAAAVGLAWALGRSLDAGRLLAIAAVSAAAGYVLATLAAPRAAQELPLAVREGVLWPLLLIFAGGASLSVLCLPAVRDPLGLLATLRRLPAVGERTEHFQIDPPPADWSAGGLVEPPPQPIRISFRRSELRRLLFVSSAPLIVTVTPDEREALQPNAVRTAPGEAYVWRHNDALQRVFPTEEVDVLYVRHRGRTPATLDVTVVTELAHPQVTTIFYTAGFVVLIFALYLFQRAALPKASAVALSTFKSEIAQPLFLIILCLGAFALVLFVFIPYNTFGEDIKLLKDSSLTLITVLCLVQAVWASSVSVAEEVEGRTALTVLSKPIGRRSFLIGKYLGILWMVVLLFVVFGLVSLVTVSYKPIYDSRETATAMPPWELCHLEMVTTVPGLLLSLMETMVLAALSVAISTRLPLLANFTICFAIYVLGHLTPLIVQSSVEGFEIVKFVGQLLATIFPNLEDFNIQAAVTAGRRVPIAYLGWSLVYCLIYTVIAMLLALVMFEDRDLA